MSSPDDAALRDLSTRLLPEAPEMGVEMAERIRAEIPIYAEDRLVPFEELNKSCTDNFRYILGILSGTPRIGPDVPQQTGIARAEMGVPYAAVLQAYRMGGRFIWETLVTRADDGTRDSLLRAAAEIWSVTDELSGHVTDAYRTAIVERARRDQQTRAALLGTLLDGDTSVAAQLIESATALKLPPQGEFVVAAAECPAPATEALPDVESILRRNGLWSVWRLDHDRHDGLIALRAGFTVDDVAAALSAVAASRLGLSAPFDRVSQAPDALREARAACAAATPRSAEVVRYDVQPLAVLIAGSPEAAAALAERVLGPVLALAADDRTLLIQTLRVWLSEAGSTSAAATRLHLHRNTVRYRLRRVEELTGRDLAATIESAELHVALEAARILDLA